MYATKLLSLFKSQPEAASMPPPEGRNSGYLVVKGAADDETHFFGLLTDRRVRELPFPQDRVLKIRYTVTTGEQSSTHEEALVFVPVPDQPLASNRYYAVVAKGRRKGLVRACSREEDMAACCFCRCISDVEPRPFHPADIYQQIEIVPLRRRGRFTARAVAADGFPSKILRHRYWEVYASKSKKFGLGDALGLDAAAAAALRSRQLADGGGGALPEGAAVGKWYSPFFLVREAGVAPREQMERSAFYEVTLEQRWDAARCPDDGGESKIASRKALIGGIVEAEEQEAVNSRRGGDGYVWFRVALYMGWVKPDTGPHQT